METIRRAAASPALFVLFFLFINSVSGLYPRAQNVTWISNNFKTILSWGPEPTVNYSYTVEYSAGNQDKHRVKNCVRSSSAVCDVSSSLTDLKACYIADVLSEPPLGMTTDEIEFPYSSSTKFCPYQDTDIGRPEFRLEVSDDKKKTTVHVTDPLTALFKDGRQLNIRDIFGDDLQYRVTYRKNKSTGKKVINSKTSVIEMTGLDRGVSYCFNVEAYIPSRSKDKQLGEPSATQCTEDKNHSPIEEYSPVVIAVAVLLILLLVAIIIGVTVFCCKRRRRAEERIGKEGGTPPYV